MKKISQIFLREKLWQQMKSWPWDLSIFLSGKEGLIVRIVAMEVYLRQSKLEDFQCHQKQKFFKKVIAKKCWDQVCQLCSQTKDIPCIGCDYESQSGKQCDHWVHATCLGFPEQRMKLFRI